ncbi:MAG: SpoIID/LytB domain-containing protein [Myxococcota bacterium]
MSFKTVLSRMVWLATLLPACSFEDAPVTLSPIGGRVTALEAYCTVNVQGVGVVDIESDYLPRVVACENGAASSEALRAQAVAARSYVYYRLATGDGSITDGQGDQVYSCSQAPTQRHFDAVASTAGEVLQYQGTPVAAFYVAGAIPQSDTCIPSPTDEDRFETERYVTYNWERAGGGVEQSSLGFLHPANHANRGCHSQNGAHCLADAGWSYEDILRFYYGADIEHVVAEGDCVAPLSLPHGCGEVVGEGTTIFDESSSCFLRGCTAEGRFESDNVGEGGRTLLVGGNIAAERDCFGRWQLSFSAAGPHRLEVHLPDDIARVGAVTYLIRHGANESAVTIDQSAQSGWVPLGVFTFAVGSFQYVELSDLATEAGSAQAGPYVVFDAVRVTPTTLVAGDESDGGHSPDDVTAEDGEGDDGATDSGEIDGGAPANREAVPITDGGELSESLSADGSMSDEALEDFTCDCAGSSPLRGPPSSVAALSLLCWIARRRNPSKRRHP